MGVCQPREPTQVHPQRQVQPLNMARANELRVGRAVNGLLFRPYYLGRTVPGLLLGAGVGLNELAKVSIVTEDERDVVRVSAPAVC